MTQHAIVAIDHHTARIYHLDGASPGELKLKEDAVRETDNRHATDGKRPDHQTFFHEVAKALKGAKEIIIVGAGTAKDELKHHLDKHDVDVAKHVVSVESINHPTEPQLLAMAKQRFKTIDAWLGDRR